MAHLPILKFPDPRLRTKAKPVAQVDARVRKIVDDMLDTMYAAPGIGLAATQVNIHEQIIVIDVSEDKNQPMVFINPRIETLDSGLFTYEEGCLSVPGFYEAVERPEHIKVTALDRDGNSFELMPTGLLAVCIQHELDHLKGKLFVDYLSTLKRNRIRSKLEKQKST
jgi:peptide deformylase